MQCKEVELALEQEGLMPPPEAARAHLAECISCRNMVADLTAVVAAAHTLPIEIEPPSHVWVAVRSQLESEGIIKTRTASTNGSFWSGFSDLFRTRALAMVSVGAIIAGAVILQMPRANPVEHDLYADTSTELTKDEALLSRVQLASGSGVDTSLRQNLKIVDQFIEECEKHVKDDPQDDLARDYLSGAYQQKAQLLSVMMDRQGSGN
jgi:hypothetical protein